MTNYRYIGPFEIPAIICPGEYRACEDAHRGIPEERFFILHNGNWIDADPSDWEEVHPGNVMVTCSNCDQPKASALKCGFCGK